MPLPADFDDKKEARELLARAPALLEEADASPMLQRHSRSYPTLALVEVQIGSLLGTGGFGCVYEVSDFTFEEKKTDLLLEEASQQRISIQAGDGGGGSGDAKVVGADNNIPLDLDDEREDHPHYHVDRARQFMKDHVQRNGEARYAIKRLKKSVKSEWKRVRGMVDLTIEAKYLSALWHPNIVKMRAIGKGDFMDRNFFIVMDRLFDTLAVRIKSWKDTHKKFKGGLFGRGANKSELQLLMTERMTVAYDLSSAFRYMHSNKLVYRDIRKENIGFDVRGDVKVFDFGMVKSLSPSLQAKDAEGRVVYGYNLTPRSGSIPFMAPEVVEQKPYDTKCDVFSFSILLWEILALKPAYGGIMSPAEYRKRIVFQRERPPLHRCCSWWSLWPAMTRQLIKESWNEDPRKRPDMKQVAAMLRVDLNEMTTDSEVQNRTKHMLDRSENSFRLERRRGGGGRISSLDQTNEKPSTLSINGGDEEDGEDVEV